MRVGRARDSHAGLDGEPHVLAAQIQPAGQAIDLERDARLERHLDRPLEIEVVRRAVPDQPPGRVAQASDGRMAHGLGHTCREFRARCALPAMERELDPLELGEHVVRQVEAPVTANVALHAAQNPERRQLLVRGGDLLALATERIGVEAGHDPDVRRVIADREVLVASLPRSGAHLVHGRAAVRPGRVGMQVSADLVQFHECRRLRFDAGAADLGGGHGRPSRRYMVSSSGASGSAPRAAMCSGGPVARTRAVPSSEAGAVTSSIGIPSAVIPVSGSSSATISGRAAKRSRMRSGSSEATTTARRFGSSVQRRASPAGIPPSAAATCSVTARARGSRRPGALGPLSRSSAETIRASVAAPIPGTSSRRPLAAAARNSGDGRDPECGRDGDGALRSDAQHATERRKLERRRPPQLRELGNVAGLDQLEKARFDARADALQLPDAAGAHECSDVDRRSTHAFGGTTVRAGTVVAGIGKLEQRREFIQPGRDAFVADLFALAHLCRVSGACDRLP